MTKAAELAKMGEVLTNSQIGGRRNIVLNPKMAIAQRGTSFTGKTADHYIVDRFTMFVNGAMGTWTTSQSSTVPTGEGFAKSIKLDCTTADASPASSDILSVQQRFEGQDLQQLKKGTSNAEKLTVSFYVRSNKTGTYIAELEDRDNTRYVSQSYTISSANTWEKKTVTFPADTSGALDDDNAESLRLNFWLGGGSNFTSGTLGTAWHTTSANRAVGQVNLADSTDNEWYITGVQLEVGSQATPFEHRSFGEELALCQRYFRLSNDGSQSYQPVGNAVGYGESTAAVTTFWTWEREMRATPTLAIFDEGNSLGSVFARQDYSYFCDGVALGVGGKNGLLINLTVPNNNSGDTTFQDAVPAGIYTSGSNIAWSLDAEL